MLNKRHPLLYALVTRPWLRTLSLHYRQEITLANIPHAEFARWSRLGFTHVWLIGVWRVGARAREIACHTPELEPSFHSALPDWQTADVTGSLYAIADYVVADDLGGETGLAVFRQQLHAAGLHLILDFIPNHTGLDHPWLRTRPELFVPAAAKQPGSFLQENRAGQPRWIAHGRDPFFAPWQDTAQLDYRCQETHDAMANALRQIARWCDGVRCDMAMLMLKDVFDRTWREFPPCRLPPAQDEFWPAAIQSVRASYPEFLFLAEVYWGLEARLQHLGFDFTYDKTLYDLLVHRRADAALHHLYGRDSAYLAASAHFLENHDEPRVASLLAWPEHRATLALLLALPGLRLLQHGQLEGATSRVSVHLARAREPARNLEVLLGYERLLELLATSTVGRGDWELLDLACRPGMPVFGIRWRQQGQWDVLLVNLGPSLATVTLPLRGSRVRMSIKDPFSGQSWNLDLTRRPLVLDLPGHSVRWMHKKAAA